METKQATFGNVEIEESKGRHTCKKIQAVSNGERIYCGNRSQFRIKRSYGESTDVTYRCGMHLREFKELL